MLEDVRFAEVVKRKGMAVQVRPAAWAFRVRLYRSLSEIINGYTKNLYEGLGRNPVAGFGAALFLFICALLPFVLALSCTVGMTFFGWKVISVGILLWLWGIVLLQTAFRYRQEVRDGRDGRVCILSSVGQRIGNLDFTEIDNQGLSTMERSIIR